MKRSLLLMTTILVATGAHAQAETPLALPPIFLV